MNTADAMNPRKAKMMKAGMAAIAHLIMNVTIDPKGIFMSVTMTSFAVLGG